VDDKDARYQYQNDEKPIYDNQFFVLFTDWIKQKNQHRCKNQMTRSPGHLGNKSNGCKIEMVYGHGNADPYDNPLGYTGFFVAHRWVHFLR
jgi:hypothetical protein